MVDVFQTVTTHALFQDVVAQADEIDNTYLQVSF